MRGALESFRFSASVVLAAELDLSRGRDDGWGAEEARRDLVRCGAVEKWISLEWIKNHFQWIIWKLASYEYNFPETKDAFMKPTVVLKQLLYRYVVAAMEWATTVCNSPSPSRPWLLIAS